MNDPKIPRTADGEIIYPGMPVFIVEAFSIERVSKGTVYCVLKCGENEYDCVIEEERFYDGYSWNDGNTEHTSRVFSDYDKCNEFAKRLELEEEDEEA